MNLTLSYGPHTTFNYQLIKDYGFTIPDQTEKIFFSNEERIAVCERAFPGDEAAAILEWYMKKYEYTMFGGGTIEKNCEFSLDILQGWFFIYYHITIY